MKLAGIGRVAGRAGSRATTFVFARSPGPPIRLLEIDLSGLAALANDALRCLPHIGVRGEVMLDIVLPIAMLRFAASRCAHIEYAQCGVRALPLALGDAVPFGLCFGECDERGFGHAKGL